MVADWFRRRFGAPTEAQTAGWPAIAAGQDTLIAAPTGSGKTLAAFLWCLDRLLRRAIDGRLTDETEVVYVSPLKALSHDVEKNLAEPLRELEDECAARLLGLPRLRVAVRTGDTPMSERQKAVRRPPHILITTPESLYILLTASRSRAALTKVKTVIVDEIHALAGNKRGAHLALSLERLEAHAEQRPVRVGLSATQRPLEEVARFLVGTERANIDTCATVPEARPVCTIVDVTKPRALDLAVETPVGHELSAVATHEMWDAVYDRVAELAREHRTTLVFANTRRLVERVAHALGQRLGEDQVAAHHGSLARLKRHEAEQKLKAGEIKLVVATASLELGLDIGAVELVVQLGSPRGLSVLVQRIGRSGHWLGGTPKGRLFALTRDEVVECAALVRAVRAGHLDTVAVRRHPLDVLAQQLVAECAADDWDLDALYQMVRRAWPYARLERGEFDQVVDMLSRGFAPTKRSRNASGAHLHLDAVNRRVRGRRGARLAAITSGGAIPDNADFTVVADPEGVRVGTVSEDFAVESMRGDIFLLGNTSWRIRRVEAGTVRVEDAQGAPPTIPFWVGEAPGRSFEASAAVSALRRDVEARLDDPQAAATWLERECNVSGEGAQQAVAYLAAGRAALGAIPSMETLVAERFFDEAGGMQLIVHAPFGSRINRAWGLALRKRFCRSFNFELQAAATDDGIVISLGPHHSFPLDTVFRFVTRTTADYVLTQALLGAPIFPTRWRWTVTRALALLRFSGGRRVPPNIQRMRAEDLLAAVFPDLAACPENLEGGPIELPDHPLVNETVRDCLAEPLDLEGLEALLGRMEAGEIQLLARDVAAPSPFSEALLNAMPYAFLDDAPLEERRTRAVMTRRPGADARDLGALDAAAIAQAVADARPPLRDADELHDALLGLVLLPVSDVGDMGDAARARRLYEELERTHRAGTLRVGTSEFWVAAERLRVVQAAFSCREPGIELVPALVVPPSIVPTADEENAEAAHTAILRGWMEVAGPVTVEALASRLALSPAELAAAFGALEAQGQILRGHFTPGTTELEWCDRRLLARIHQLTLGRLRQEIAPVAPADFMRFLFRWQHVLPGTQLQATPGLKEILSQLQGFELAAAAWEREVLPRRVARYQSDWLDELCWRGEVAWARLGARVAVESDEGPGVDGGDGADGRTRRTPGATRATPVGLYRRADLPVWLDTRLGEELPALHHAATEVLHYLRQRGASFFQDLTRGCRRLPTEVATALGELVAAGLVTGDSFAALRSLFGQSTERAPRMRRFRPGDEARRHSTGRWSLLGTDEEVLSPEAVAEARARQLLRRYGVVFRDLLVREGRVRWGELLPIYRRMEARGELRGGRFVASFIGEQFALPEAVEALREVRRTGAAEGENEVQGGLRSTELVAIAATDPLNLVGIITPGPRVPAVTGNVILYRGGVPIASREGGELVNRTGLDGEELRRAERLLDPGARPLTT